MIDKEKNNVKVLAFDLGASSGRAILGFFENSSLRLEEVHRFANDPIFADGHLRWNFDQLLKEIFTGIEKAGSFDSVGFDTWGVDFGLLDENGALLEAPVHYRDERTKNISEKVFQHISKEELYALTGNQIMPINTLFQLMALQEENPALLKNSHRLMFMPDLFAHALCHSTYTETTIASTSQMLDPVNRTWARELLEKLQIPNHILPPIVKSGSVIGKTKAAKVIAVAGHDTQCAVAALPSERDDIVFLSCGTWALLGTELNAPILTRESMELEFSNEIGADGKIQYLKNITGLWLIQECRRHWNDHGTKYSFDQLAKEAVQADAFQCFIDPNAPMFSTPGDMPDRIKEFCLKTGQHVPKSVGEICRCIYESLAFQFRFAIEQLGTLTGKNFSILHILGGGSNVELLCQTAADCTGLPVIAGPSEATALGNILIQLHALGHLQNLTDGRKLLASTQALKRYEPHLTETTERAYARFCKYIIQNKNSNKKEV